MSTILPGIEPRQSQEPKVCIVVLNWNRPSDTLECLGSLLPVVRNNQAAIVVCDNASSDNSLGRIREWAAKHFRAPENLYSPFHQDASHCPDWRFSLIRNRKNLGYAGGNNAGISFAVEHGDFAFIWVLNNDTTIDAGALDALLDCARNQPAVAVFGSTISNYYQPNRVQCAGGCRYYPLTTIMKEAKKGKSLEVVLQSSVDKRLDYISGAAFFIRTKALKSAGLFDEAYFLYYEELDLCNKLRKIGQRIAWCKSSIVYHKGAASTGGRSTVNKNESGKSNYHENLSTLIYTFRHHPLLFPFSAIFRLFGKSLIYLLQRRFHLYSTLFSAYRNFFASLFTQERSTKPSYDIEYIGGNTRQR